jgi:electron transfer flavoprotein beta subunit
MNVLVLIAGIADPKWPLPAHADAASLQAQAQQHCVMSPFDEAALELALKLRDADPSVRVEAVVGANETLARKTAGWRLDAIHLFDAAGVEPWDCRGFAASLAHGLGPLAVQASLILAGREYGDYDDGSVSPALARALGLEHVNLALAVRPDGGSMWVSRQRGAVIERLRLAGPAVLSVTNDSHNRLRHPLLKNVMAARTVRFNRLAGAAASPAAQVTLAGTEPVVPRPRAIACRLLHGTPRQQAEALALALTDARRAA